MIGGLRKLPKDPRDLRVGKIFGKLPLPPNEDFKIELKLKNQGHTDMCGAYAGCSASEPQEGVELDPNFQFAKIKQIEGRIDTWGSNLRDICRSLVKVGSIEASESPYTNEHRDFVANWTNWDSKYDDMASEHRKQSYFVPDGWYDTFDNFRANLWDTRKEKGIILTGTNWRQDWKSEIIPKKYGNKGSGHAFVFNGQKIIDGIPYLIAHLSNGQVGDNGEFYFSREIVNKEIGGYGMFIFRDENAEEMKKTWNLWQIIYNFINNFIKNVLR